MTRRNNTGRDDWICGQFDGLVRVIFARREVRYYTPSVLVDGVSEARRRHGPFCCCCCCCGGGDATTASASTRRRDARVDSVGHARLQLLSSSSLRATHHRRSVVVDSLWLCRDHLLIVECSVIGSSLQQIAPVSVYLRLSFKHVYFAMLILKIPTSGQHYTLLLSFNFWATVTRNGSPYATGTDVLFCLSVTLVYCGQTVGWIKMPLCTEVGLDQGDIVLDGTQLPPPTERGTAAPTFWPMSFRPMSTEAKRSPISATAELL